MAEPGDPTAPATPVDPVDHPDLDDAVGFASPDHLRGRARDRAEAIEAEPSARPSIKASDTEPTAAVPSEGPARTAFASPAPEPPVAAPPPALPDWARETPRPAGYAGFGAHRQPVADIPGASGLTAVYALILFAVPTLGVSALIALLAVTGRPRPDDATAASHFVFQQRTLWVGGVVALLGAILIVVGLGVFVLFALAVWLILRGAAGVLKLKAGRPIADPRGWLI